MTLLLLLACADPAPAPVSAPAAAPAVAQPAEPPAEAAPAAASPRDRADEAFNTAMRAFEGKEPDSATPIRAALEAYAALGPIDTDGQFHVALLQLALGDDAAARATAEGILAGHPKHVLGLAVAAQAADAAGDKKAAKDYYSRVVDTVDQPTEALPEFSDHDRLVGRYQADAVRWLTVEGG